MLTGYEKYQLEWMIKHGYSLERLMECLEEVRMSLETSTDGISSIEDIFSIWNNENGFDVEIWTGKIDEINELKQQVIGYARNYFNYALEIDYNEALELLHQDGWGYPNDINDVISKINEFESERLKNE